MRDPFANYDAWKTTDTEGERRAAEADWLEMHETVECGDCGHDYGLRCELPPDTLRTVGVTSNFKRFTYTVADCPECGEECEVNIVVPEPDE